MYTINRTVLYRHLEYRDTDVYRGVFSLFWRSCMRCHEVDHGEGHSEGGWVDWASHRRTIEPAVELKMNYIQMEEDGIRTVRRWNKSPFAALQGVSCLVEVA